MNSYLILLFLLLPCYVHSRMVGGWSKVKDPNASNIEELAKWSLAGMNDASGLELSQICKAETQVVAGVNYRISFLLREPGANNGKLLCEVKIFTQSWTNTKKLTTSNCEHTNVCLNNTITA
ncbi:cysteine proteinase inhibitor 8-like isoform X2 [Centruroides sculpturatus]|uniref:cysteine proteinase inhibitor 8-like isoform X2 n=1 Tax=Centruroides sculpturatus TaxID=218467 RepID=UPI000C6E0355|nr:cysteine proteinase inhibitor 8-like isoform X2 [Centruroides sculpturatus]